MGTLKLEKGKNPRTEKIDEGETCAIYLPDEIVVDILTRLPVKCLLRFKSVCKKWNSLMREPAFIHVHYERARTRSGGGSLIISMCMRRQISWELWVFAAPHEGGPANRVINRPELKAYRASKSVNGLIALFPRVVDQLVYISNPSTRELVRLPPTNFRSEDPSIQLFSRYSFGYDPAIQQHKVLNICCAFQFSDDRQIKEKIGVYLEILTVGSNEWRKLDNVVPPPFRLGAASPCVNGAIHWRAFPSLLHRTVSNSTSNVIVAFDIGIEKFRVIPLSGRPASLFRLMEVGGRLALNGRRIGDKEEMWVLEDYYNGEWVNVMLEIPRFWIKTKVNPFPVGATQSGKFLMLSGSKDLLWVYYCDKEGKEFNQFKITGLPESKLLARHFPGALEVTDHVESLFSARAARSCMI